MKKLFLFLPLILLMVIVSFLMTPLMNKEALAATEDWRDKPFPEFVGKNLLDQHTYIDNDSLPKEPYILNIWGSWCGWCIKEFPVLHKLKQQGVQIVGLTYADHPDNARKALAEWGNPFSLVIDDYDEGFLIQTLRVSSAPSSYLIDKNGIVRYQQKGYNPDFEQDFLPILEELRKEDE
ncbi:DsbE family thiol:disulfide interchange protein [[Haemophilus] ducreyi]|uniref:DsbE family thiol:disulfide interchange protein n=1 Tax=Haemophilus ducreyi TaxID=730 RepID=UPI000655FC2E|nr:DsbE family thiol:disulfide interchange protein [[Haemophilus] ducreyi]AKO45100.1 dihydroneopterin aldolase [[Haemophilus] ducreyi]AKO46502.1 dihydroneopterin aldolase [[Haemophilus] ducreyi]AKO47844.1 dihydroneopterin aldolase [[Haemophilus] ducreyi]AKO49231.1 dihydroneopterin aldolase [[Haemophilus] ducreyi]ANF62281.1 dihydroneopterin aldolase [[Haemophilus] ducreyi]